MAPNSCMTLAVKGPFKRTISMCIQIFVGMDLNITLYFVPLSHHYHHTHGHHPVYCLVGWTMF